MRRCFGFVVVFALLSAVFALPLAAQDSGQQASTENLIKEYVAATEALDLERTLSLYSDDIIWEDPGYGDDGDYFDSKAKVSAMYEWLYSLPDVKLEDTNYFIAEAGDWATVEWTWSGINGDEEYMIRGVSVMEIADGKIVREVIYYDPTTAP